MLLVWTACRVQNWRHMKSKKGSADFEPAALLSKIQNSKSKIQNPKSKIGDTWRARRISWLWAGGAAFLHLILSRRFPPSPAALMYRTCLLPPPTCTTTLSPRVIFTLFYPCTFLCLTFLGVYRVKEGTILYCWTRGDCRRQCCCGWWGRRGRAGYK